jgi:transposase-like protein
MIHRRLWFGFLLGITLLLAASTVQAAPLASTATRLTIQPLKPVVVGKNFEITVHLTDMKGERIGAVANEVLLLFIDDVQVRRIRTDQDGTAVFPVRDDYPVGKHKIQVFYKGSKDLLPSSAEAELQVVPAVVEVHTVPPLANLTFSLAGRNFYTDEAGVARIEMNTAGTFTLEFLNTDRLSPDTQAKFSRWADEVFTPYRQVIVPMDEPIQAGFDVSHLVSQTFVDLAKQPVDPKRITSLTIKGSNGVVHKLEDGQPRWLTAGRVVRRSLGLEETRILYSVVEVIVDGSNVVSQAQQKFYVNPKDLWEIQILLYSAHFTARDALFRFPIGKGVRLEYPDRRTEDFLFDSNHELKVDSLARGLYHVTVIGASGMAPPTPLAMSKDQTVELIVLSSIDMAFALALGLSLALGLLFYGRPYLLQMLLLLPRLLRVRPRAWRQTAVSMYEGLTTLSSQQCPVCNATTKQFKAGLNRSGSQKYRCRVCGKVYTPSSNARVYSAEVRERALQLYLEGNSRRSIARTLNISSQTISKWINDHTLYFSQSSMYGPIEDADPSEHHSHNKSDGQS